MSTTPLETAASRPFPWRVAGGVFILTVLVYWSLGPRQSGFDYQLSQANNIVHGHLDLVPEFTRNLNLLERVLFDGEGFCLPIDDPRGPEVAANIANPRFSDDCKHYMQHSLGPSFMLVPLAWLWGLDVNQTLISVLLSGITAVLAFAIARRFSDHVPTQLGVTALAMFGTTLWFSGASGDVWHFAHTTTSLFLFATIYATVVMRNPLLAGVFVGMAFLCRPSAGLAGVFPLLAFSDRWLVIDRARALWQSIRLRPLVELAIGVAPFVVVFMAVNHLRFGSPFESGYSYGEQVHQLDLAWRWPHGLIHPSYLPLHLEVFWKGMAIFSSSGSFVWPSWGGMAMWATSPALLIGLFAQLKRFSRATLFAIVLLVAACAYIVIGAVATQLQLTDLAPPALPFGLELAPFWLLIALAVTLAIGVRDRLVIATWVAIIAITLFDWMFAATGWAQFGYRYGLDFMPFLFLLVAIAVPRLRWYHVALIAASIVVNLWGVLWIYQFAPRNLFGWTWVSF